jgi:methionyl-tRNA formyltransferase
MAPMLKKSDGQLDFSRPAAELERRLRAFTPWPAAFTHLQGERVGVRSAQLGAQRGQPGEVLHAGAEGIEVACGEGSLWLKQLQPEGKRVMSAAEFLAGRKISPGSFPFESKATT